VHLSLVQPPLVELHVGEARTMWALFRWVEREDQLPAEPLALGCSAISASSSPIRSA
jgi:hypothetical protein